MTTFDSTKRSLPELLKDITNGKIQLPDFQRAGSGTTSMSKACWSVSPDLFRSVPSC